MFHRFSRRTLVFTASRFPRQRRALFSINRAGFYNATIFTVLLARYERTRTDESYSFFFIFQDSSDETFLNSRSEGSGIWNDRSLTGNRAHYVQLVPGVYLYTPDAFRLNDTRPHYVARYVCMPRKRVQQQGPVRARVNC